MTKNQKNALVSELKDLLLKAKYDCERARRDFHTAQEKQNDIVFLSRYKIPYSGKDMQPTYLALVAWHSELVEKLEHLIREWESVLTED